MAPTKYISFWHLPLALHQCPDNSEITHQNPNQNQPSRDKEAKVTQPSRPTHSLVTKEMNSETRSCRVSLVSPATGPQRAPACLACQYLLVHLPTIYSSSTTEIIRHTTCNENKASNHVSLSLVLRRDFLCQILNIE